MTHEADTLIAWILKSDKDVLHQLLTTDKYFVHHTGNNNEMAELSKRVDDIINVYKTLTNGKGAEPKELESVARYVERKLPQGMGMSGRKLEYLLRSYEPGLPDRKIMPDLQDMPDNAITMYNLDLDTWSYQPVQPTKIENRMGILTHPAWLIAFSKNTETDPIHRGKWIREKLLAGIVPDVPITVDARVPEAHDQTLRQRIGSVTEAKECWNCHQRMNPLGYPFECFDDFGRYRTSEELEYPENIVKTVKRSLDGPGTFGTVNINYYKTLPVSTEGYLEGSGDKNLDGEVKDPFDLIRRIANSERVRQSFIRNVFRYFMGRNEMLSDSKTLIEADKAYVQSGGSFNALIVSLLTSDSFIYRK